MKIRPVGDELFRSDRRTDMTKPVAAFRNFANAPKTHLLASPCLSVCPQPPDGRCMDFKSDIGDFYKEKHSHIPISVNFSYQSGNHYTKTHKRFCLHPERNSLNYRTEICLEQGCANPGRQLAETTKFLRCHLILGLQCGTYCMSLFLRLEFCSGFL